MTECPRWRLLSEHYLNVDVLPDGTKVEWEHKEQSKANGRVARKLYKVPMYLNPKDPADHTHPGEIIVTQEVEGGHTLMNDIVFHGKPTQEMEPLNDAAEAISAAERHRWINPVETLPANGGMSTDEQTFMKTMMEAFAKQMGAGGIAIPTNTVPREEHEALLARLAALEAAIAAKTPVPETNRRV